jgi:hypothetical protein
LYARSTRVGAFNLGFDSDPLRWAEARRALVDVVASGALSVDVSRTLPLAAAAQAHRALESRASVGKLVLLRFQDASLILSCWRPRDVTAFGQPPVGFAELADDLLGPRLCDAQCCVPRGPDTGVPSSVRTPGGFDQLSDVDMLDSAPYQEG